jgi:hypothetical protein
VPGSQHQTGRLDRAHRRTVADGKRGARQAPVQASAVLIAAGVAMSGVLAAVISSRRHRPPRDQRKVG